MCNGIRNDQIPLLQTYNAIRKVFTHKQHENQSAPAFKDELVQNIRAMKAVGATITLSPACLKLEANLDTNKTSPPDDAVKQAHAFERLMALTYLNQCDNSTELTCTMLKTQYIKTLDEYPAIITVAANLVKAAKKEKTNRGSRPALTLAQRAANSSATHSPFAEYPCALCGAHQRSSQLPPIWSRPPRRKRLIVAAVRHSL